MTPMAQEILNDSLKPAARRDWKSFGADDDVPQELLRAHCFDFTAVAEMIPVLGVKVCVLAEGKPASVKERQFAFLPAPVTWLEFRATSPQADPSERFGLLLRDCDDDWAFLTICVSNSRALCAIAQMGVPLGDNEYLSEIRTPIALVDWAPRHLLRNLMIDIYPMLAMINSPKVIGRRQHMPHVGLERKLARARGMVGRFPLLAWTEILLHVTPPKIDGGEHEAHLTGRRALHFCRAHLRIQFGKLVVVSSHWRGDPALGIKRSRYIMRPGAAPLRRHG
jgi:hypothetical protein